MLAEIKNKTQEGQHRGKADQSGRPPQAANELQQASPSQREPQIKQRPAHVAEVITSGSLFSVTAKNTSSNEASACNVARSRMDSSEPKAIFSPRCRISTRSHNASTSSNRCEERKK